MKFAIVGAGEAGAHLAQELVGKPRMGREVVTFFDDDMRKHGILDSSEVSIKWMDGNAEKTGLVILTDAPFPVGPKGKLATKWAAIRAK